jgi:hypothetical protein
VCGDVGNAVGSAVGRGHTCGAHSPVSHLQQDAALHICTLIASEHLKHVANIPIHPQGAVVSHVVWFNNIQDTSRELLVLFVRVYSPTGSACIRSVSFDIFSVSVLAKSATV